MYVCKEAWEKVVYPLCVQIVASKSDVKLVGAERV